VCQLADVPDGWSRCALLLLWHACNVISYVVHYVSMAYVDIVMMSLLLSADVVLNIYRLTGFVAESGSAGSRHWQGAIAWHIVLGGILDIN
jgi:hypothetical protein